MNAKHMVLVIQIATGLTLLSVVSAGARINTLTEFDAAKTYKSKCVSCHGAKAEKKFDATKPEAESVQIILHGKKLEKPPHMPGYKSKGITEDQAKALLAHM